MRESIVAILFASMRVRVEVLLVFLTSGFLLMINLAFPLVLILVSFVLGRILSLVMERMLPMGFLLILATRSLGIKLLGRELIVMALILGGVIEAFPILREEGP